MRHILFFFCFLTVHKLFSGPLGNRPGRFSLNLQSKYFQTTANYDNNGNIVDLEPGKEYSYFLFQPEIRYDYSDRWSLFSNVYMPFTRSNDSEFTRESFNLTAVSAGADYMLYDGTFRIIPSAEVLLPITGIESNTDETFATDGVFELKSKIYLARDFGIFYGYGSVGFNYRTEGRSSLATYEFHLIHQRNRWAFSGGVSGFYSAIEDEKTSLERAPVTNAVNGGSLKFYSVNPEVMEFNSWVAYYLERQMFLKLKFNATINGTNYAQANYFGFDVFYSFGGEKIRRLPKLRKQRKFKYNEDNFDIKYDYDEDEDVFDDNYYIRRRQEIGDDPSLNSRSRRDDGSMQIQMRRKKSRKRR